MADERTAKVTLQVDTKGDKDARQSLADIGKDAEANINAIKKQRADAAVASQVEIARIRALGDAYGEAAKKASDGIKEAQKPARAFEDIFKKVDNTVENLADTIRQDLNSALKDSAKQTGDIQPGDRSGGSPSVARTVSKFSGVARLAGGSIGGEIAIARALEGVDRLNQAFPKLGDAASSVIAPITSVGESIASALVPALGESAAGIAGLTLAAAPFILVIAAIGLAVKSSIDTVQEQIARTEAGLEARRGAVEAAGSGATVEDARKKIDEYNASIKTQTRLLDESKKGADARFAALVKGEEDATGPLADLTTRIRTALNLNDVNKFTDQAGKSQTKLTEATTGAEEWTKAVEENAFAVGDAADAAKAHTDAVLASAAAAGQEVAARRKADDASYESNQARLGSIDDEKAALQAQLDVLQSSGDTSEAVASQIEKLTGQLGSLGKEADYINTTALAASKIRDAAKKSAKDAEAADKKAQQDAANNAQKAADAQQKYADSVKNAGTQFKQSAQDINTKLGQALTDNLTGLFRDVDDIAQKFRRDTFDQDIKAQRDERDALIDHYRDVDDIRADAQKNEQESIRDGDFKQLFLARQSAQEAERQNARQFDREGQDRSRAQTDERSDLLRDAQRTRADRLTQFDRQNSDSRLASDRELTQAQVARTRMLTMAAEANQAALSENARYLTARNQQISQANAAALQGGSGRGIAGSGIPGTGISGQGIPAAMLQVIRR